MTKAEKENQIKALENLGLTAEEIAEVLADDEKIDKGEKLFDLPDDLEQGSKKARQAGNTAGYTKPQKKEKPIDEDKRLLINTIAEIVENLTDEGTVYIENAERELTFFRNNRKFKIVLSCPRK
jgi:hypothetical protein